MVVVGAQSEHARGWRSLIPVINVRILRRDGLVIVLMVLFVACVELVQISFQQQAPAFAEYFKYVV